MEKSLEQFIKDNQKFFKLDDGETFTGVYQGYKVATNRFDPEKETVAYIFKLPDSEHSIRWECGRIDVAKEMGKVQKGETVTISRKGSTQKDTEYSIVNLDASDANDPQ
jgi:hypothetical protein